MIGLFEQSSSTVVTGSLPNHAGLIPIRYLRIAKESGIIVFEQRKVDANRRDNISRLRFAGYAGQGGRVWRVEPTASQINSLKSKSTDSLLIASLPDLISDSPHTRPAVCGFVKHMPRVCDFAQLRGKGERGSEKWS